MLLPYKNYISVVILCLVLSTVTSLKRSNPDLERHTKPPSPKWDGLCETGSGQSPINIERNHITQDTRSVVHLRGLNKNLYKIRYFPTGYTLVFFDLPTDMQFECSLMMDTFIIEEMVLHWQSEHLIDGQRYALELQMVYKNRLYPTLLEAQKKWDGIMIVSLLFHIGEAENVFFDTLINGTDNILQGNMSLGTTHETVYMKGRDNPIVLSSLIGGRYGVLYDGSLTRPPCVQSINWLVILSTVPAPQEVIDKLRELKDFNGQQIENNYREAQPRNDRMLLGTIVVAEKMRTISGSTVIRVCKYLLVNTVILYVLHYM